MPKFLEDKLKREYGAKSKIPYKIMNSIGAMRGNKETNKGKRMEKKHERDMKGITGVSTTYDHNRPKRQVYTRYKRG